MYNENEYMGKELELFQYALNWKKYFSTGISKYIYGDVLEVGAGIGATTKFLCSGDESSWTCLEPDINLATIIERSIFDKKLPENCKIINGTIEAIPENYKYDSILYIDVIEHIQDDKVEITKAASRLKPYGNLIILVPAYQFLYTPFDEAIGHYRRYHKNSLIKIIPPSLELVELKYFDSAGLIASLGNKLLLKESSPSIRQIMFWDRCLVPISKFLDKLSGHGFGRSLIGIWKNGAVYRSLD